MNSTLIALLAFAAIFVASLLGMRLRAALPDHHLSADTKDSVRVGMGLVATMTALLLGLWSRQQRVRTMRRGTT